MVYSITEGGTKSWVSVGALQITNIEKSLSACMMIEGRLRVYCESDAMGTVCDGRQSVEIPIVHMAGQDFDSG